MNNETVRRACHAIGLAEADRGKQSVTYYLTEKGFQWLEKECGMVIHTKT